MGELGVAAAAAEDASRDAFARDDGRTAWTLALLVSVCAVPLIALLARPVGSLLVPQLDPGALFPWAIQYLRPEPREQGMYALALVATGALAATVALAPRQRMVLSPRATTVLSPLAKALLGAVLTACLVAQYRIRYEFTQGSVQDRFFTPATLLAATAIAAVIVAGTRSGAVRQRAARALAESRGRRSGAAVAAVAITAIWLLHAIETDRSIGWAAGEIVSHLPYTLDETFATVNGLTPLVSSTPLYGTLWPYVFALPLLTFGKTLLVFTLATTTVTALALLAGFGILRRATGSSTSALLLYLPFLATSLFIVSGKPGNAFTTATSLAHFPLRYAGPLLLAWLTAREVGRADDRPPWALFAAAGLVLLNNLAVGLPALAATAVAVATTGSPRGFLPPRRLMGAMVAGLLLAATAIAVLTLAHGSALPHVEQLWEFSQLFLAGYGATPMHGVLGVHLAVFLTFVGAVATGTVRVRAGERDVMTGMLLWTGVFGLGSFSYFVAESGPLWLVASFSTWALALMLLTVLVVRRIAARRPDVADLAVLFGTGVLACSLAQVATPWSQLQRLTGESRPTDLEATPYVPDPRARRFIASLADGDRFSLKRGAPVALLFENSHRVADAYGVVNVSPYANAYELFTRASLRRVVDALRRAGGNTIVISQSREPAGSLNEALIGLGFGIVTADGIVASGAAAPQVEIVHREALTKWVDLRHRHPRALDGP